MTSFFVLEFFSPNILLPIFLMVGILVIDLPLYKLYTVFLSLFYACLDKVNILLQVNIQDLG